MKQLIIRAATCALIATAAPAIAQGLPTIDPLHDFASTSGYGKHYVFKKGEMQAFAFNVPESAGKTDIVFSDDPNTRDRTSRLNLVVWKEGGAPQASIVNYSRVRTSTFQLSPGRHYFTLLPSADIAFALTMIYRKPVVPRTTTSPPRRR